MLSLIRNIINNPYLVELNQEKSVTIAIAVTIGVLGLTAMAGYYFLSKKNKND